jgi:hypothetical protein
MRAVPPPSGGAGGLIVGGVVLTLAFLAGFALASNLALLAIAYVGITVTAGIARPGSRDSCRTSFRRTCVAAAGLKGFLELLGSVLASASRDSHQKGHPTGVLLAIGLVLVIGTLLSLALVREGTRLRGQAAMQDAADGVRLAGPVTTLARQAARETLPVPDIAGNPSVRSVFTRVLVSRFLFLLGVYGIGHFLLYYIHDRLHLVNAAGTSVLFTAFTAETALVAIGAGCSATALGGCPSCGGALLSALGAFLLVPASTVTTILLAAVS